MSATTIALAIIVTVIVAVSSLALLLLKQSVNIHETAMKLEQVYKALQDIVYVRRENVKLLHIPGPAEENRIVTMSILVEGRTVLYIDNALYNVTYGSPGSCARAFPLATWLRASPGGECIQVLFGLRTLELVERNSDVVYVYVRPEGCKLEGYVKLDVDSVTVQPGVDNKIYFRVVFEDGTIRTYVLDRDKPLTVKIVRICGK